MKTMSISLAACLICTFASVTLGKVEKAFTDSFDPNKTELASD